MNNDGALPWYKSTIIVSALVSLVTKVLVLTGIITDLSPEDSAVITNAIVLIAGGIADIVAVKSRVVQKVAPSIVTSSKKAQLLMTPDDGVESMPEAQEVMKDVKDA